MRERIKTPPSSTSKGASRHLPSNPKPPSVSRGGHPLRRPSWEAWRFPGWLGGRSTPSHTLHPSRLQIAALCFSISWDCLIDKHSTGRFCITRNAPIYIITIVLYVYGRPTDIISLQTTPRERQDSRWEKDEERLPETIAMRTGGRSLFYKEGPTQGWCMEWRRER